MSHVGGESVVPRASRWGAVLRCVRRRCAPAHSAPPGPPTAAGRERKWYLSPERGTGILIVAGALT